jgi:translation initiation factor IF-2
MSKKDDLLERINRGPGEVARPVRTENPSLPTRAESVTTRVSRRVVRRRRRGEPEPEPVVAAPVAEAPPPVETQPEESAPQERVEESREPTAEVPREPTAEVPREPTAEVAPVSEPVQEVAPEPTPTPEPAAEVPAEPATPSAPAPEPEPVPVAAAAAEPAATPDKALQGKDHGGRFAGLGKAVVMPPPGYDPTNPLAYRREQEQQQQQQKQAQATATATATATETKKAPRGRRRVEHGHRPDPRANRGRRRGRGFDGPNRRRRKSSGPKAASPAPKGHKRKVRIDNVISVGQLAHQLSVKPAVVIRVLMDVGEMVNITAMLDLETASVVASEFEYEVENVGFVEENFLQQVEEQEDEGQSMGRPPVVTIMGHVDHGKTTLLDAIRKARVAEGEAGSITQHIGAYQVETASGGSITFIDTPGHQAFTAMRARGAQVTDLIILVVAADDGVQPQTEEAIAHAKAAEVPIIVAVNKMDKPGVTAEPTKQRLSEHGLQAEDWGGDTMFVPVSALRGDGLEELLEAIHLQSEMLDLKANPDRHAEGMVIEAKMERGRGAVATVLVQQGTLNRGDYVVLGSAFGKVRALMDYKGGRLKSAGPSTPVEVFGLSELPEVGDEMAVVKNEKNARKLAEHRGRHKRDKALVNTRRRTAEDLFAAANAEEHETLLLIVKADVQGTLQALKGALEAVDVGGAEIRMLHAAVGPISESDVNLASANGATLIGFNCAVDAKARTAANQQGVVPELYSVIYDVLDRVEGALKGMLAPVYEQVRRGSVEVRVLYRISRVGTVAGSYVLDGTVGRNHVARVLRKGTTIWEGKIAALKRFKDDVKEVAAGYECGVSLDGFNDLEEGDVIESYSTEQVERV